MMTTSDYWCVRGALIYQVIVTLLFSGLRVQGHRFSVHKSDQNVGILQDLKTGECTSASCSDEPSSMTNNKWTLPLLKTGDKRYYLGTFFKANWYRASQFCRYHGMQLASVNNQEENDKLERYVTDFGLGFEHFWTSGTDLAEEGSFFWMSTGRPISFTNWNAQEPNNFKYENGEEEHCLELWNRDGKGLKWNDSPCSFETYFICETSCTV